MRPFSYIQAREERSAIELVTSQPQSVFLAGGTTLLDLMKLEVMTPDHVVDINPLALTGIETLPNGGLRIGAMVRNSDMAYHDAVRRNYPLLSEAILQGASEQLRNMATLGGNIMQRTRCPYFRDTTQPCNKREPGSGCSALNGFNRIHAVLGVSSRCIAAHPSDMCVALAALDAVIHTRGPRGERDIPFNAFHLLPGDHPERETVLEPGELITAITVPPLPFATRSLYLKLRDRASYAFALVSVAAALDLQGRTIRNARLALGGVGARPWRAKEAEKALIGKPATEATYQEAAAVALHGAKPAKYNAFKVELAKRAIVRTLTTLGEQA
ncbi:MAG TPA: xanthine dehydrogenase family protein subunit M [Chthonomonadaceae bacterium]|nr:xanthine dehydrogenase family protein subunit M [Chthonomonadaceae bacterium]